MVKPLPQHRVECLWLGQGNGIALENPILIPCVGAALTSLNCPSPCESACRGTYLTLVRGRIEYFVEQASLQAPCQRDQPLVGVAQLTAQVEEGLRADNGAPPAAHRAQEETPRARLCAADARETVEEEVVRQLGDERHLEGEITEHYGVLVQRSQNIDYKDGRCE